MWMSKSCAEKRSSTPLPGGCGGAGVEERRLGSGVAWRACCMMDSELWPLGVVGLRICGAASL